MERVRVWEPTWGGTVESWTKKFCRANQWRVAPYYDEMDLYQDSFLIFIKIKERYPRVVEAPHFFQLYKVSVLRYVDTLAKRRKLSTGKPVEREPTCDPIPGIEFAMHMNEAPLDVRRFLKALTDNKTLPGKRRKESRDAYVQRIAGFRLMVPGWLEETLIPWVNGG